MGKWQKIIGISIIVVTILFLISACMDVYLDIKDFMSPTPMYHALNPNHLYFGTVICGSLLICLLSIMLFIFLWNEKRRKKH